MNVQLTVGEVKNFSPAILKPDMTPDASYRRAAFEDGSNIAVAGDGSSRMLIDHDANMLRIQGLRPSPIGNDGDYEISTYSIVVEPRAERDRPVTVRLLGSVIQVRVVDPAASSMVFTPA